jgi:iron complex transport system permease protein
VLAALNGRVAADGGRPAARWLIAQELPVGVLTAVLGGSYLLWLMHRRGARSGVA